MFLLTSICRNKSKCRIYCFKTDSRDLSWLSRVVCQQLKTDLKPKRKNLRRRGLLVDKVRIYTRGGSGGMGCPSSGGAGGKGGNVYAQCVEGGSLSQYVMHGNRRHVAEHGTPCKRATNEGKDGRNKVLTVPPGTTIYREDNTVLKSLNNPGDKVLLAKGGAGGTHRTEKFNGMRGDRGIITLELKLLGDVGLAGFPNAGKSTLLRSISNATPKVADYAFTTLRPTVGIVKYPDHKAISYTDLPGLIEDAHLNRGMGHKFLRHIERTKAILMMVDINGFQLNEEHRWRSPVETIALLMRELYLYQKELISRDIVLALNKTDTDPTGLAVSKIKDQMVDIKEENLPFLGEEEKDAVVEALRSLADNDFDNVFGISAKNGSGLLDLTDKLRNIILSLKEDGGFLEKESLQSH